MNPIHAVPNSPFVDPFSKPEQLSRLLAQGGQGYTPTDGFHIYTELRTTQRVQAAEDERRAASYVKALTDYVNFGATAASVFKVTLLEAQGEVLHFFKEGPRNRQSLIEAIQFVHVFTKEAYAELRNDLGNDWQGLASSLDGGNTVVLRHANYSCSSAISLAPSANRPAKRLLYGGTKAGHLDIHKDSAALLSLRPSSGDWHELNLRDRESIPYGDEVRDAGFGQQLNEAIRNYRREVRAAASERISISEARNFSTGTPIISAPQRVIASSVRCDLDGFSRMVEIAFSPNTQSITLPVIVQMFLEILRFGDHMLRTTQGAVQLPWAGDCATTIIPDLDSSGAGNRPRWLEFAIRWQQEFDKGAGGLSERTRSILVRNSARWAIGGCHGDKGLNILAPVVAQSRTFLIGVGWPVFMSLNAQNLGAGDDVVTRKEDYDDLDAAAQSCFKRVAHDQDYWKSNKLTQDRLVKGAIEIGKASRQSPEDYLAKISTIQIPSPRPHCE